MTIGVPLDFAWLVLTYAGMLAAAAIALSAPLSARDGQQAGRAAWCTAWWAAMAGCLFDHNRGPWVVDIGGAIAPDIGSAIAPDVGRAMAPAAWMVAAALLSRLVRGRSARIAIWLAALVPFGFIAIYSRGPVAAAISITAITFGGFVDRAIQTKTRLLFRLGAYWASFVGTFAIVVPLGLSARDGTARLLPLPMGIALAVSLVLAAAPLALAATRAFATAGGTPEPLDAPPRLCQTGIYRRLRHPIQLAEILFVAAGACLIGTRSAWIVVVVFAVALIGPLRLVEERKLAARFGGAYDDYKRWCPAFLPRFGVGSRRPPNLHWRPSGKAHQ